MKTIIGILLATTTVIVFSSGHILRGQNSGNPPNNITEAQKQEQLINQSFSDLRKIEAQAKQDAVYVLQTYPAKIRKQYISLLEKELLLEDVSKLKPAQKHFIQFAEFLKNKNTGLARLFPDEKCDQGMTVSVKELERCANSLKIRGGGSFYSFRNRTNLNESGAWADLHLIDGKFVIGSTTQFGLIRELEEDISLDDLNVKSKEFSFLLKYKPKFISQDVKLEKEKLEKGLIDKFFTSADLKINSTYILRSIAYQLKIVDIFDYRADMIVAFKVISQEDDGSIILLWKQLKSKEPPKLKGEIVK